MTARPPAAPKPAPKPVSKRAPRPPVATPGPDAAGLHLDRQLCFALYATSLAMTRVYRPLLAPLGLTYPQYVVMLALWEHGELSAGSLGERVSLDSGTLVALVRKLVATGRVERRRSASDDRSVLISLTPDGAALRDRAHAVHAQVACATQRSAAQLQALVQDLQTVRGALTSAASAGALATRPPPTA